MSIYKDQMDFLLQEMQRLLDSYNKELEQSATGHLVVSSTRGKRYYYQNLEGAESYTKVSLNNKPEAVRELARKEFLVRSSEALSSNIRIIGNALKHYRDEQLDALKAKMHKAYLDLPDEYFLCSDFEGAGNYSQRDDYSKRRHDAWAAEDYEMSSFNPEGRRFPTSRGLMVRSKSEQHIAEQLYKYDVPFRYEQMLHLDELNFSVDFTFQAFNNDEFYWEHAGMMDLKEYAYRHNRKMRYFEANEIVPWKNLIVTYDVNGVVNIPFINSIIEHEVIPKL